MLQDDLERWVHLDRGDALHIAVTVVILTYLDGRLQVLMTENDRGPYEGHFVLPHRILRSDQMLDELAREVFCDSAERSGADIEQYFTYSCPDRDPRGRVLAVGYLGAVSPAQMAWVTECNDQSMLDIELEGGTVRLRLGGLDMRPGFFHDEIIYGAISHLRNSLDYSLVPFMFLPERFTLRELQEVHEAILGKPITMPWFRQKMLKRVFKGELQLRQSGAKRLDEPNRPAELYELMRVPKAQRIKRGSRRARV